MTTMNTSALGKEIQNIEIEINSRCNRRCSYCPVSILPNPPVPKFMNEETLSRITSELKRINYSGRISYHFYNEPLLRKDLEKIVSRVASEVPLASQILFTNGDYLTDERHRSLLAAGVKFFVVTSHSGKEHPTRARQYVQYSDDLELTNRGGILVNLPGANKDDHLLPCFAPSEMLVITVTGEVVLCYEDAFRKHIVGDIRTQSIEEIWYSEELLRLRGLLENGKRGDALKICASCTNRAHARRGLSAQSEPFWKEISYGW